MKLVLAPLAGFTDAPFRQVCRLCGADQTMTEMVSAAALAHGSRPTLELLETLPDETNVGCQIFGATASDVAIAARVIDAHAGAKFCELNLNAGCPMTKVTRCGAGAKLIEDPAKIFALLVAMRENSHLPVTLKTRLGPRPDKLAIFELLDAAERAGATEMTVHARFTSQLHGGATHLDLLADVVAKAKIPIIGNGSIVDDARAREMRATGVAGLMIGRAALANPAIFRELKNEEPLTRREIFAKHVQLIRAFRPTDDAYYRLKFRTHLFRYFAGIPGAAALRAKINQAKSIQELEELCCWPPCEV